jgi:hypothetical protein
MSSAALWVDVGVLLSELMASLTGRLPWAGRISADDIFLVSNWLQMGWVDAMPNPAQMIKLHTFGDWADPSRVAVAVCLP